jgi:hypothetical protein
MDWKTKKPATPPTPDLVPLPMGMADFHNWADVIISQTGMTATVDSQKFVLANLILELPPDTDAKEDEYFIKRLRKVAANQVADNVRSEIRNATKARLEAEQTKAQPSPPAGEDGKVLAITGVQKP